jgi:hypothetical protein
MLPKAGRIFRQDQEFVRKNIEWAGKELPDRADPAGHVPVAQVKPGNINDPIAAII